MLKAGETALRLTVVMGDSDQWHHHPAYHEILKRAHASGLAGASVFRGIEGFGASGHLHTTRVLSLSEDLPVSVVIVDAAERIQAFLPQIAELVGGGLVMTEPVEVVMYTAHAPRE
jgi:PII-like signaling protein